MSAQINSQNRVGPVGLAALGWFAAVLTPPAIAQLFESPDAIVTHCLETNVLLNVRVNNSAANNPNANHSVDLGCGVDNIRNPEWSVTPNGECVDEATGVSLLLGKISSEHCGNIHYYHSTAPRQVPWNSSVLVPLAAVTINGNCPSFCTVTIKLDYFYENDVPGGATPDTDQKATYTGTTPCPPPLTYPEELLQPQAEAAFVIKCIAQPPQPAKGESNAQGQPAQTYVDPEFEPGLTRVSFDLTRVNFGVIPTSSLSYFLGTQSGPNQGVATRPVSEADFRQTHVVLPTPVVDSYRDEQGRLQFFILSAEGILLFTSDFGPAPRFTVQPQSRILCAGEPVMLHVAADGEPPFFYTWYRNGEFYTFGQDITVLESDRAAYQAFATNSVGQAHSEYAVIQAVPPAALPPVQTAPQRVPERWQDTAFTWSRDTSPHNKIDDQIDAGGPGPFDIIVNFNQAIRQAEATEMANYGNVQLLGKYVPFVAIAGVSAANVQAIAADDRVVFVQKQQPLIYYLDVATQATKVRGPFYSPNTVTDQYGVNGTGVNIAIIDSGVDDPGGPGVTNLDLPPAAFFYDALTTPGVFVNPDDTVGHGTHVAGIALGRGTPNCPAGVAPAAGLIDVRVGSEVACLDALQTLIANHLAWNVGVVNMSIGFGTTNDDGQDSLSLLVNTLAGLDVVVICAAGNNGPGNVGLQRPGAADLAITVANSQDQGTPNRLDDILRSTSSLGPRASDNDGICTDEFRPEITAPGTAIRSALFNSPDGGVDKTGTSMAAPHVAGAVALMLQSRPGWRSMTAVTVRQALISTAERRGAAFDPACDPEWDRGWGWGLLDAFRAVSFARFTGGGGTPGPTNLRFVPFAGQPYASTSIDTLTPPRVNVPNTLRAQVENVGPADATFVLVRFKIDYISATNGTFYVVGDTIVPLIPAGAQQLVEIPWTPQYSGHQCLKAEIGYAGDVDPHDDHVQRNIAVAHSPVYFLVENLISPDPIQIDFVPTFSNPGLGWSVAITPPNVILAGGESATIEALPLIPDGTPEGTTQTIYISSMYNECMLLGGVGVIATMHDCNHNGVEDWTDIQSGASQDLNGNHIPDECEAPPVCHGDCDCNGAVGFTDIDYFVAAIPDNQAGWTALYAARHGGAAPPCSFANCDVDGDEHVGFSDIDLFVALIPSSCP